MTFDNRNDAIGGAVFVGGRAVVLDGALTELLGAERTGRFLRAADIARKIDDKELAGVR